MSISGEFRTSTSPTSGFCFRSSTPGVNQLKNKGGDELVNRFQPCPGDRPVQRSGSKLGDMLRLVRIKSAESNGPAGNPDRKASRRAQKTPCILEKRDRRPALGAVEQGR